MGLPPSGIRPASCMTLLTVQAQALLPPSGPSAVDIPRSLRVEARMRAFRSAIAVLLARERWQRGLLQTRQEAGQKPFASVPMEAQTLAEVGQQSAQASGTCAGWGCKCRWRLRYAVVASGYSEGGLVRSKGLPWSVESRMLRWDSHCSKPL